MAVLKILQFCFFYNLLISFSDVPAMCLKQIKTQPKLCNTKVTWTLFCCVFFSFVVALIILVFSIQMQEVGLHY